MARPVGRPGETRERVLRAALELFGEYGVSGTSLQMIANRLGVTKAAVYHQFRTKDEMVLTALAPAMRTFAEVLARAEREQDPDARVEVILAGLVDMVVDERHVMAVLQGDPAVRRILDRQAPGVRAQGTRLSELVTGPGRPGVPARVALSMMAGGLALAGIDPELSDLDDATLRRELLACARHIIRVPVPASY